MPGGSANASSDWVRDRGLTGFAGFQSNREKAPDSRRDTASNNRQRMTERDLRVYTGTYLHTKCTVTDTQSQKHRNDWTSV